MTALKPCPACGWDATYGDNTGPPYWVACPNDCLYTGCYRDRDEAAAFWNSLPRRDDKPAQPARDEREAARDRRQDRVMLAGMAMMQTLVMRWLCDDPTEADDEVFRRELPRVSVRMADALLAELAKGEG